MNTIREVQHINDEELARGIAGTRASWHSQYAKSAWIYLGNLDHGLSEGDVICVLSQYGEIDDFHLVREEETGKSKGFAFCKYEDARSCVLAVDNFCGIELCGRSLRVDHVENYRLPKHLLEKEEQDGVDITKPGLAYHGKEMANKFSLDSGQDLFAPPPPANESGGGAGSSSSSNDGNEQNASEDKEAKRIRKEERQLKRQENAQKKQERQERKMQREEERRKRRAKRGAFEEVEEDEAFEKKKKSKKNKHKHKRRRRHDRNHSSEEEDSGKESKSSSIDHLDREHKSIHNKRRRRYDSDEEEKDKDGTK
mmetsp:Transcript_13730/g.17917  ORF Transcript_13730/g.17917 Transcript_13730/m.17917 type:complete len:311 (-) Transcript_13730:522-1454(-)|eukprot:CAMPEP_0198151454 /NCGR_PEP_ID=MMETSP1443-20131203/55594_1 /TAXON_ID=186043 /ORGANISM="Entomoneis sp., Strain CCMP2396" /LENGTH=310 /DNA_ID=CAMNT_0043817113 /DNA_START=64 /DNA_END=996 /DNA_ORIENTATION=-